MASSSTSAQHHTNRLAKEKSPYLLQHADNPVDWYPWGEEAFKKAREEKKPIFLSVGYSTCHWCHVMAHESFENEEIAKVMNENFVNVKVDREVQPDVDRTYMTFVQATTGGGGWPMSVFLTPDLYPIYGGTYFPPRDQFGRPGFPTLLKRIASLWKEDPEKLKKSGMDVMDMLRNATGLNDDGRSKDAVNMDIAHKCYKYFVNAFDSKEGGFGGEPKFPTPVQFHFLLRYYYYTHHELGSESLSNLSISQIHAKGNQLGIDFKGCLEKSDCIQKLQQAIANQQKALEMVKFTLVKIARGGIHDHVGNGFHRYSTDRYWHVPHFEKMLYDQAQLLATYIEVFLLTKEDYFAEIARDIIKYVVRDLRDPVGGGFYSAEDADSYPHEGAPHKLEGAFAAWEKSELDQILGEDSIVFCYHFGVEEKGNVPREKDIQGELINKNVLIERYTLEETAKEFSLSLDALDQILKRSKEKLAKHRAEKRPKPHRDDKILTAWNGLMISALARAYEALGTKEYLSLAENAAKFLKERMYDTGRNQLLRSFREGPGNTNGFSDDYSFLIQGLIDLYECSFDENYLKWAIDLQETQNELFYDQNSGGYFNVPETNKDILLRMKDDHDGAEPSANSVAVSNLIRLHAFTQNPDYHTKAEATLQTYGDNLQKHPYSMPSLVSSVMLYVKNIKQIVFLGDIQNPTVVNFLNVIRHRYIPNRALLFTPSPDRVDSSVIAQKNDSVKYLLQAIDASDNKERIPSVHICENFTCGLPIRDVEKLEEKLSD